jgi:hypothetical protein
MASMRVYELSQNDLGCVLYHGTLFMPLMDHQRCGE